MKLTADQLREKGFVELPSGAWAKGGIGGDLEIIKSEIVSKPSKRLRQNSKPLMNELETEFHESLKHQWSVIAIQAVRFKLGNGIWYKPDFVAWPVGLESQNTHMRAYEVKGPFAHRGGFENLKVAASLYRQVWFKLVWKDQSGKWLEQSILP